MPYAKTNICDRDAPILHFTFWRWKERAKQPMAMIQNGIEKYPLGRERPIKSPSNLGFAELRINMALKRRF
jgi:hypothetical protein